MVPVSTGYDYLSSLLAVRERCFKLQEAAKKNKLKHFDIDTTKLQDMVHFVISLIRRDYNGEPSQIPQHGRWRHFDVGGKPRIQNLISFWSSLGIDKTEQTRRVLDLFIVAVLLDFDPGLKWSFKDPSSKCVFKRREGTAIAVLNMFMNGAFSDDPIHPHRVDSEALASLKLDTILDGFQINSTLHPELLIDLDDRLELIQNLAQVLRRFPGYFGGQEEYLPRPGNLMDYILSHPTTISTKKGPLIRLETIWPIVLEMGELGTVQDQSCKGGTYGLGDVWYCSAIGDSVPFHKLSQWMVYSIIEPMEKLMGAVIEGKEQLTPLTDYSNGGLLIDTGFITLKKADYQRGIENYRQNALLPGQSKIEVTPMFEMSDPVVVEWRALTTVYLDIVAERVRSTLKMSKKSLSLSQFIEGGTASAGRELAEISRPNTQKPPIMIKGLFISDHQKQGVIFDDMRELNIRIELMRKS